MRLTMSKCLIAHYIGGTHLLSFKSAVSSSVSLERNFNSLGGILRRLFLHKLRVANSRQKFELLSKVTTQHTRPLLRIYDLSQCHVTLPSVYYTMVACIAGNENLENAPAKSETLAYERYVTNQPRSVLVSAH